ncbi:MAG: AAA family ATPase [Mailhella sp.]|nr:AAA family ATPase [Mailhella sp.]
MRILSIRFANLNSLAGEWHIDFTDKDFLTNGIFAITGPTGSGKSTILDALCLALYGSTPRLGKISKGSNDIMTRGTGKCFAEVVFSTVHGEYCCRWSQNKAREKADGALQQASHILWDSQGKALAEKINDVAAKVKEITGMDFERFTQSTLLAQGSFAKFLLAKGPDRAPLLEEMTGTGIYSDISTHIFSRNKAEQEKLSELDRELALCNVLSPEEENELRQACDGLMKDIACLAGKEKELHDGLNALHALTALKAEADALLAQKNALEKQLKDFQPDSVRLEAARRALRFSAECSALLERLKEQARDREDAGKLTAALGPLAERVQTQEKLLAEAEQRLAEEKLAHASLLETLKDVRALDIQTSAKKQELEARTAARSATAQKLELAKRTLAEHEGALEEQRSSFADIQSWLGEHAADADLPQQLAAMRILHGQLDRHSASMLSRSAHMEEKRKELEAAAQDLENLHQARTAQAQELKEKEARLSELEARRTALLEGRTAAEWRQEKEELALQAFRLKEMLSLGQTCSSLLAQAEVLTAERLELEKRIEAERAILSSEQAQMQSLTRLKQELGDSLALLDRIQSYEEARLHLQDGEACPLCGSIHHPFAEGNIPAPDEKKLQLCSCEQDISALNDALLLRRSALASLEHDSAHKGKACSEKTEEAEALALRLKAEAALLPPELSGRLLSGRAVLAEQIAALEESRSQNQLSLADASRIVEQNDSLQDMAGTLHDTLAQLRLHSERSLQEMSRLDQKKAALQAELRHMEADQDSELAQHENAFAEMRRKASASGCLLQDVKGIPAMLEILTHRSKAFQDRQKEACALTESCSDLEKLCLLDRQDRASLEKALQDIVREENSISADLGKLQEERRKIFGERDADREEGKAAELLKEAAECREARRRDCDAVHAERTDASARLASLKARIEERSCSLAADEQALLAKLQNAGFVDMDRCLEACLPDGERARLESAERALAEGMASLKARMLDNESRMAQMGAAPDLRESELLDKLEGVEKERASKQEELGARRERLEGNERRKKDAAHAKIRREAQEKVCRRWADLNELIGSADGKKFRNYAQELTFRILIGHANRQLSAMTDRYLLVQDPTEALSLSVTDRYQADAVRTSRNLSGGESFLVSLSLALGLARMASRNVRVDSVFLDEGFGTLDEDTLSIALDMLSGLREQGKTIGIISHVQAIRERIGTQIHVEPSGNGRSRLRGPGISGK